MKKEIYMKKILIALLILSTQQAFAACQSNSKTVFSCTTNNNKVVQVCDAGKTIQYSFGKAGQTPELAVSVARDRVTTYQWEGIGRYENYAINIPNGKTIYRVNSSIDKNAQEYTAGVEVNTNDRTLATVQCNMQKKVIDNLEGIKLRRE